MAKSKTELFIKKVLIFKSCDDPTDEPHSYIVQVVPIRRKSFNIYCDTAAEAEFVRESILEGVLWREGRKHAS